MWIREPVHTDYLHVVYWLAFLQVQSDQNASDDRDGPKHVFSFSWLNQK